MCRYFHAYIVYKGAMCTVICFCLQDFNQQTVLQDKMLLFTKDHKCSIYTFIYIYIYLYRTNVHIFHASVLSHVHRHSLSLTELGYSPPAQRQVLPPRQDFVGGPEVYTLVHTCIYIVIFIHIYTHTSVVLHSEKRCS